MARRYVRHKGRLIGSAASLEQPRPGTTSSALRDALTQFKRREVVCGARENERSMARQH
jgi:hypothetical protein